MLKTSFLRVLYSQLTSLHSRRISSIMNLLQYAFKYHAFFLFYPFAMKLQIIVQDRRASDIRDISYWWLSDRARFSRG